MAQNHRHLDWNDLRCVLAVAEHGGLAAAARALGVNHTTVLRRVNAFEEAQGLRLFERLPSGYLLTPGGEELLASVRQISSLVTDLERRLTGRDLRLEGVLRVATTDTLASSILPRHLAAFRVRYPDIVVELAVGNLPVDLVRHDVDAAIRPMAGPSETLIGRRVSAVAFAIYAAQGAETRPWLVPDDTLAGTVAGRWVRAHVDPSEIAARADSLLTLRDLAIAGAGRTILPCYLGDVVPERLVRLGEPLPDAMSELWLLMHADLSRTARVRAFNTFMAGALAGERDLLEGRRDRSSRSR
ncbi:LysR family transcriptional regulator [Rhizobium laguerreae]|uniref:LysR family transcriptional regulator n=1 Tax=Rhizobium laguerreae TaxID=1076926 RepID=UPI001C90D6F5|nr:LysR family transcriptional regulator [Rhizobium laguerreae]MBY3038969.1 LysR family transcriptional regulator [Rhizobium laguerreae]